MPPGGFRMAPNQEQEQPKALEQFVCYYADADDDRCLFKSTLLVGY